MVKINDPKNTALLVLLPSACRQKVIFGARIGALGMKRKPRCGEEAETGECAAELEVMVMLVVVVVITMFCSSSAPLSLTHTLSFSLSFLLCLPLGKEFRNKSCAARRKPGYNPAATTASPDDITSPPGQYKRREAADSRGKSNPVIS